MARGNPSLRTSYNPYQQESYDDNNEVHGANENNENNDNNEGTDNIEVDSDNYDIDVNVNDKNKMDVRQAKSIAEVMADEHRDGITEYVTPNPQHNCMVSLIYAFSVYVLTLIKINNRFFNLFLNIYNFNSLRS